MILSAVLSENNGMATVLLVLCATVIMIVLLRRHQFRKTTSRDMSRDHIARIRDQHKIRGSMEELLIQLEEVSRRVGAQVDTKFAMLEKVIRDADERIARLEQIPEPSDATKPVAPERKPVRAPQPIAQPPPAQASVEMPASTETSAPTEPIDPRFQRVYELVDAGDSPIKIAEQLALPLGEVELILNLRTLR